MEFRLALAKAGKSSAARMAMMAMTTNNSISVKAAFPDCANDLCFIIDPPWRSLQANPVPELVVRLLGQCSHDPAQMSSAPSDEICPLCAFESAAAIC
jgi:hypothetical protein